MSGSGDEGAAEDREDEAKPLPWRAVWLCVLLSALWGGTPASIRVAGDAVPPVFGAFCRFALAGGFMLAFCRLRGAPLLPGGGPGERAQWGWCGLLGAFLTVQIALYHIGVSETNASHAALFINTFVFWVAVVEHFVTGDDRLTAVRWAGLGCAGLGVSTVLLTAGRGGSVTAFDPSETPRLLGDAICAVSGVVLGAKIVLTKRGTRRVRPETLILWHDILGSVGLLAFTLAFEDVAGVRLTTEAVLALLYQGLLVGGFCFGAQTVLLETYSASRVTAFNAASPVFGVAIAVAVLGDPLSPWLFLAAVLVAAGIVLVNRRAG